MTEPQDTPDSKVRLHLAKGESIPLLDDSTKFLIEERSVSVTKSDKEFDRKMVVKNTCCGYVCQANRLILIYGLTIIVFILTSYLIIYDQFTATDCACAGYDPAAAWGLLGLVMGFWFDAPT
jgi:hypothetical protein